MLGTAVAIRAVYIERLVKEELRVRDPEYRANSIDARSCLKIRNTSAFSCLVGVSLVRASHENGCALATDIASFYESRDSAVVPQSTEMVRTTLQRRRKCRCRGNVRLNALRE